MDPKNISIAGYRYGLPPERIANYPLPGRDSSKLLIYRDGKIREGIYRDIASYLPENSLLVFNDTKVVEARIVFQKPSGGRIEIFCLEPPPEQGSIASAMLQTGKIRWKCLIGGASKWKPGQVLSLRVEGIDRSIEGTDGGIEDTGSGKDTLLLEARWIGKQEDCFLIEFSWSPPELSFAELLHRVGMIPLPPYIRRAADLSDQERYQTVYAAHDGSVAAPTAGLHFTEAIFNSLKEKNIRAAFVTLHVGAGTFMPVKTDTLAEHSMHTEFIVVRKTTIENLLNALETYIVPVGTTSLRTIESLYWLGRKTIINPAIRPDELVVHQWDAYSSRIEGDQRGEDPGAGQALGSLLDWMNRHGLEELVTKTQLLITPGYDWKLTSALVTNFHQPESTLLLLVSALVGGDWKRIYEYALEHEFRFLSYGDGSLLFKKV